MNNIWFSPFKMINVSAFYLANLNTLEATHSAINPYKLNMGIREDRMKWYRIRETQKCLKTLLLPLFCRDRRCTGKDFGQAQERFIHDFNLRFLILWDGAEAPFDIKKYSILLDSNSLEKAIILSQ